MRFIVHKNDLDLGVTEKEDISFTLNASTSVNQLKTDYYYLLSKIGSFIQLSNEDPLEKWQKICDQDDVIFASFHEYPKQGVGCRFIKHSLGSLLVSGGFLGGWEFRESSFNVVTCNKQAEQLKVGLGIACPNLGVLVPSINNTVFRLPEKKEIVQSKQKFKLDQDKFNLIYSGRLIANKGIVQLVRALNLWPLKETALTIVGSYEPDFINYSSNTCHANFDEFFTREVVLYSRKVSIAMHEAKPHEELRAFFWASDCFVYPSFHEDENFGMAPREAMLSGIPAVVTDFCGLGALSSSKSKVVKTYPTLGGVRYSLFELRQQINEIKGWDKKERKENKGINAGFVGQECDQSFALSALDNTVKQLLSKSPGEPPAGGWRSKARIDQWATVGPDSFKKAIVLKDTPNPEGIFVYGTGYPFNKQWFSDIHFQKAVQSFYTSLPEAPRVIEGETYRGFWRIALWPDEKAVVEFGYPGPRIKSYKPSDWDIINEISHQGELNEAVFIPKGQRSIKLVQELLELGYLVPDFINSET